jgi:hypothetical protein
MPPRILRAYDDWKRSSATDEPEALKRLVGTSMDHVTELSNLISFDNVKIAIIQGGHQPAGVAMAVATAWRLYLILRPRGPAAVSEATAWIMKLVPNPGERRRVFQAVLDNLIKQVG